MARFICPRSLILVRHALIAVSAFVFVAACAKKKSSTASSSAPTVVGTKPSTVADSLSTKATSAGSAVGTTVSGGHALVAAQVGALAASDRCSEHAEPIALDASWNPIVAQAACTADGSTWDTSGSSPYCRMAATKAAYPGNAIYCVIAKNTGAPDSIQGAFSLFRSISCAVERAGITWHATDPGSDDSLNVTFDSNCFSASDLQDVCNASSCTMTGVGVRGILNPDSHFDSRLKLNLSVGGSTIYYDAKVKASSGLLELLVNTGETGTNQYDAYYVKHDSSANAFTFEGRFDRKDCIKADKCRWARHFRIYADLSSSSNPESVEAAISNLYLNGTDANSNGNIEDSEVTGYVGELITARGTAAGLTGEATINSQSSSGVNNTVLANVITGANLNSQVTSCATPTADPVAGACSGISVVSVPSGVMPFFLPGGTYRVTSSPSATQYLDNSYWFSSVSGLSFTSVNLSQPEP